MRTVWKPCFFKFYLINYRCASNPKTSPLCRTMWIILAFVLAAACPGGTLGCQLPHDWRPQTDACRAELAEIIVFAKVLALHKESYSVYNYLPWQHDTDLLFSAEIELLCDQAWGSMLEVPAGSRFNVTGLGYFPCFSYSVTKNNNYYFFLRWEAHFCYSTFGSHEKRCFISFPAE